MNRNETSRLISEHNIRPKKSKGQNFLTDERVALRHISFANVERDDRVLEVGPGLGILTAILVDSCNSVTAIELDDKLADHIQNEFGGRVNLIRGDALDVEWPAFDKFVSNLPYSISTPAIFKLLDHDFKKAVVMVQKEFAERMIAKRGEVDYSRLTVNVYYRAECRILENVPASRFKPRPKVDSALVEIIPRPAPFTVEDERTFFKVVDAGFIHRRKKIRSALRTEGIVIPDGADVPFLDDRMEILSPEDIGKLSDAVFRNGRKVCGADAERYN
ncbi:MAG: 16S rRNA (adenine(1518)-N(6)/adenine(1519)-N(6))-dimethyltransferase RsmA [Methanomassiliicoccaceae archaeon]|jgi:16S rRNA (adenine1518-N6/adenine1519-N6)-dimethyltransferase|nr:16S rRNA (adenine(1518)-N(6)/adenine(1519)-N(6))-dimethyltransferase RsmA [Methanomassiliicoccaceae archaeon]